MKKAICMAVLFSGIFLLGKPAQASVAVAYGSVSVSSYTYTAMVTTTQADGMAAINICNESSTGTIRCGYDVNVSTEPGNSYLGFPVLKNSCAYKTISNIVYCKSEVDGQTTPATREVFK